MKRVILDGGTTNTRLSLWEGDRCLGSTSRRVGSCSPERAPLFAAVREALHELLEKTGSRESEISHILASGMITSEFGLFELPHLLAPAGVSELARGVAVRSLPEITSIPFWFIPGVKSEGDRMRGEETECMGILAATGETRRVLLFLPGTHDKLVLCEDGKILDCLTVLSGEMLAALSQHTVLREAVPSLPEKADPAWLARGAAFAEGKGLGAALFRVRVLSREGNPPEALGSFFVGAVLQEDVHAAHAFGKIPAWVGGKEPLRSELTALLRRAGIDASPLSDEIASQAVPRGALLVEKERA